MGGNKLKPGDRVDVCLKQSGIVSPYTSDYDEIKTLEIIAKDSQGFFLHVPHNLYIKNSYKVGTPVQMALKISLKYLGEMMVYVSGGMFYRVHSILDGCVCKKCREFVYMAEANQPDKSFICWNCRTYPYH